MKAVKDYISEIINGTGSLISGMKVTIEVMVGKTRTVQWPRQYLPLPERFRGHIELLKDEATGFARCFACGNCARTCPSKCITVKGKKPEGAKKKSPNLFLLDYTKCSLCGLCVESCPANALSFSKDYCLAGFEKGDFSAMNLLSGLATPFEKEGSKEANHA